MTGMLYKKYHVAIMDSDQDFVCRMVSALKEWYNSRIVIETYFTSKQMFEGINVFQAKNNPVDLTILSENDLAEKLVLKQTNPSMPVLLCHDEQCMKKQASKYLL